MFEPAVRLPEKHANSRIWIQLFSFISSSSLILEWNRSKVSYCLSLCFHQSAHFNVVEFFLGYSRRFTIQTDRFCGGTHKQFSLKTVPDRKGILTTVTDNLATVTDISTTIISISASVSYNTDILATVTNIYCLQSLISWLQSLISQQ